MKAVVRRLEHYDMFGIDEDLNGRLFETFLSATMRGAELGQYFTPRSIVKLMVRMANLKASRHGLSKVIDICCGTGGFLIEALSDMRNKIRSDGTLTASEKRNLNDQLSNETMYGIDFGKNPPIARIARINMYLHGDGGSRIYYADALDKDLDPIKGQEAETLENQEELRKKLDRGLLFDVALTNPPFSMTKELANESEARILKQYDLAATEGTTNYRASLRSSAMFLERNRDLLAPQGSLYTVIDDTLLASADFGYVRDFIRRNFIIRGIISLPGDAFRRQGSRVKTSVICLEKRANDDDEQPDVFYAFSESLGVDDLTPRAPIDEVENARKMADAEIEKISSEFMRYLSGDSDVSTVSPDRVADRLDLKYVVPLQGRYVQRWKRNGIQTRPLKEVVEVIEDLITPQDYPDEAFQLLSVTYSGYCRIEKLQEGKYIKPTKMNKVHTGDLVFSNIRATDGAVGVVPEELDGALVSGSFTILRCKDEKDTIYLWSILRSHEIRADLMSTSTGTGRYTTNWDDAQDVLIPWLSAGEREGIAQGLAEVWRLEKEGKRLLESSLEYQDDLGVESEESKQRVRFYKPPQ